MKNYPLGKHYVLIVVVVQTVGRVDSPIVIVNDIERTLITSVFIKIY